MSRVYVVNEPTRKDGGKTMDLSPAYEHGELVFLTPPGDPPMQLAAVVEAMKPFLKSFTSADYLLPVGHPMLIAAAGALAARASGGRFRMLLWRGSISRYMPVEVDLG